jgi:hypothetical protein
MFGNIDNIKYDIDMNGRPVPAKNIFTYAYVLQKYMRNNRNVFDYTITSTETPEGLAYRYYGDPELSWVILLANDIKDIYTEWPRNDTEILKNIQAQFKPAQLNYRNLKRTVQLPPIPKSGTFDGQVIYVENTDKTYEWASGTSSWNWVNNGLPRTGIYDQEFNVSLNDYHLPTAMLVSTATDLKPAINKTITVYRNSKATFNVWFSNRTKFYLSKTAYGAWKENAYNGEYRDGLSLSRVGDGITEWHVPADAPDYIYYHSSDRLISGQIKVLDIESQHYVEGSDGNSLDGYNGRGAGNIARVKNDWYIWNGKYMKADATSFMSGWTPLSKDVRILPVDIAKNTPVHYVHKNLGHNISNETYANLHDQERLAYKRFSRYDQKFQINEKNRTIKLIRKEVVDSFIKEWQETIK